MLALACGRTLAQTAPPPAPPPQATEVPQPAPATAPAKIADFEKRFAQGKELEQAGKLTEALAVFDGIIAESPEAKGSLREAGLISIRLGDLPKACDYLEKLHALVPDYPAAIESLIQINQTLKRDVKVLLLLKEFRDLHASGKVPEFTRSLYFVRERIHLDPGDEIVLSEFFDYQLEPNTAWMAETFDAGGQLKRRLLLNYDPRGTKEVRAKDPKLANAEQFLLVEDVIKDGQVAQVDAYFQMFALPEYKKVRATMLGIIAGVYKPVYSQAVNASAPASL